MSNVLINNVVYAAWPKQRTKDVRSNNDPGHRLLVESIETLITYARKLAHPSREEFELLVSDVEERLLAVDADTVTTFKRRIEELEDTIDDRDMTIEDLQLKLAEPDEEEDEDGSDEEEKA